MVGRCMVSFISSTSSSFHYIPSLFSSLHFLVVVILNAFHSSILVNMSLKMSGIFSLQDHLLIYPEYILLLVPEAQKVKQNSSEVA